MSRDIKYKFYRNIYSVKASTIIIYIYCKWAQGNQGLKGQKGLKGHKGRKGRKGLQGRRLVILTI